MYHCYRASLSTHLLELYIRKYSHNIMSSPILKEILFRLKGHIEDHFYSCTFTFCLILIQGDVHMDSKIINDY